MNDQQGGDAPKPETDSPKEGWVVRAIRNFEGNLQERKRRKDTEGAQDRATRRTASATVWIALFTIVAVGVGISQAVIFNRQLSAMKSTDIAIHEQLEVMETDKRPWLKVDVSIIKPIHFDEANGGTKGINIPLTFNLKNYGQVPAINVRVSWLFVQHPGNDSLAKKRLDTFQKGTCDDARRLADETAIGGVAIFPGESSPDERRMGAFPIYQTDERIVFVVFGCVDYTYGNGRHGQTGFRMRLGQVVNKLELGLPFIEGTIQPNDPTGPKVGYMQPGDFYFRPDEVGNYAK